jgi:hypothetical protein
MLAMHLAHSVTNGIEVVMWWTIQHCICYEKEYDEWDISLTAYWLQQCCPQQDILKQ